MKFLRIITSVMLLACLALTPIASAATPSVSLSTFFTNNLSYAVAGNPVNVSGEYQLAVRDPWALLYSEKFGGFESSYLWKSDNGSGKTPNGIVNFGGGSFQFKSPNASTTAWYYPYATTLKIPVSVFGIRIANHTGTATGCDVGVGINGVTTNSGYVLAIYRKTTTANTIVIKYKKGAAAAVETTVATLSAALPANSELMLIHNGRSFSAAVNDGGKETIYGNVDLDTTSFYDMYDEATLNTFSPTWYFSSAAAGLDTTINEVWDRVCGTLAERECTAINYVDGGPVIIDGMTYFIADSGRPQGVNAGADALTFAKAAALANHGMVRQYSTARNAFVGYTGVIFMRRNGHIYPAQQPRTFWDDSRNSWYTMVPDWYQGAFYTGNGNDHEVFLFETKQDILHGVTILDTANATNLSNTLPFPNGVDPKFYDPDIIKSTNGQWLLGGTTNAHAPILFRGSHITNITQFVANDTTSARQIEGFRFFRVGGNVGIMGGGFVQGGIHVWDASLNYIGQSYTVAGGSAPNQYNILPVMNRGKTTYYLTGFTTTVYAASKPKYNALMQATLNPATYLGYASGAVHFPFNEDYSGPTAVTALHDTRGPVTMTGTATMQDGFAGGEAKFVANALGNAGSDYMVGNISAARIPTTTFTLMAKLRMASTNNRSRAVFCLWNGPSFGGQGTVLLMTNGSENRYQAYITQSDGTLKGPVTTWATTWTADVDNWVKVTADGTNLKIYMDDMNTAQDSVAYNGTLAHTDTCMGIACQPNATGTGLGQQAGSMSIEFLYMTKDVLTGNGGDTTIIDRQGNVLFDQARSEFMLGNGTQQQTTMGKMFAIPLGTFDGEEFPQRAAPMASSGSIQIKG